MTHCCPRLRTQFTYSSSSATAGVRLALPFCTVLERARPRMGILATHAIQYQAPLYRELSRRAVVDLDVAFLSLRGARPYLDPGFGVTFTWDIDLLGGYTSTLLEIQSWRGRARWPVALRQWLYGQDVVVIHGHAHPAMLCTAAACRVLGVPYLLRGESHAQSAAAGWQRSTRHMLAWLTVTGAAGALPIGQRNTDFYQRYGSIPLFRAPYSVDNDRFAAAAQAARPARAERLASLGLDPGRPTVIFSGKLTARKRPLDAIRAIERCDGELNLLMLGDGPLLPEARRSEASLPVRCLGFVNQAELPAWYASGDLLVLPSEKEPWGLAVNEGMACGLVPVVSDAVGCAADLVDGIGETFGVGDVGALASALVRAAGNVDARRAEVARRIERYSVRQTAHGYEQAALSLGATRAASRLTRTRRRRSLGH
jgi:glycosyltransferase involved in cell wall biosynthesis